MIYPQYIERNPSVLMGKPIVKGTRISVELIMRKLAEGLTIDELIKQYPNLKREQIAAALEYAAMMIANDDNLEAAA